MTLISIREMIWLFLIYSFMGWVLEIIFAALKSRRFVNKGLVNGPFCILYGFSAVFMTITLQELQGVALFVFAMIYASVMEWISGHLIELIWHERWWDYSHKKWNIGGYVCLTMSVVWGILGYIVLTWGNHLLLWVFRHLPQVVVTVLLITVGVALLVDIMADVLRLFMKEHLERLEKWEQADNFFTRVSYKLGKWIYLRVDERIHKAYPDAKKVEKPVEKPQGFARGAGFYKIVLLFFIGAFLGDIVETIFCRITAGVWMSRSSVIWGAFSIVWGLAIALATALLHKYKDRSDGFLFAIGAFLGGAYEYLCSVFTEIAFGKVFWDYSAMPFNLGGRINLLYCFFWGIAAVVWLKKLYPFISRWIETIPVKIGKAVTWCLILFMLVDIMASVVALSRYTEREQEIPASNIIEEWMDVHYNDEKMMQIYPNAISK